VSRDDVADVSALGRARSTFGRNKVQNARLEFRTLRTEHFDIYYYPRRKTSPPGGAHGGALVRALLGAAGSHVHRRQPIVLYASHPEFSQTNVNPARSAKAPAASPNGSFAHRHALCARSW
jgi:hypothetical protein